MRLEALSGTPLGTYEQQFAYAGGSRLPAEVPILFQVHGQRVLDVALNEWTAPEPEVAP